MMQKGDDNAGKMVCICILHCQNEIVLSVGELQYEYDNKTSNKKF